jgi:hypothetical protein
VTSHITSRKKKISKCRDKDEGKNERKKATNTYKMTYGQKKGGDEEHIE